ncbi:peptidase inhibitor family I36 protein [Kitasatospora sp. NPDC056531]|uniref:peptidase inhibitor family I36 protein n=1 Tax=Kitasatospora sp. NPDC056531 TaxID=3345856 RepID=UPI0036979E33
MRIRVGHRTAKVAVVGALTLGAMGLTTGSAFAATPPTGAEACPSGNVCLYYHSPQYGWGAWENWSPGQTVDLRNAHFSHWGNNGAGWGQTVADNAASLVNNTGQPVAVVADDGTWDYYRAGYADVLDYTYNKDAQLWS